MKIKINGIWATKEVFLDGKLLTPGESLKIHHHSQRFSWGNKGPASEQLALAILLECTPKEIAISMYQDFQSHIIAQLPKADFNINLNVNKTDNIAELMNGKLPNNMDIGW